MMEASQTPAPRAATVTTQLSPATMFQLSQAAAGCVTCLGRSRSNSLASARSSVATLASSSRTPQQLRRHLASSLCASFRIVRGMEAPAGLRTAKRDLPWLMESIGIGAAVREGGPFAPPDCLAPAAVAPCSQNEKSSPSRTSIGLAPVLYVGDGHAEVLPCELWPQHCSCKFLSNTL